MAEDLVNVWEKISIWCLNHEEPVKMGVMSNTEMIKTPFYACGSVLFGEGSDAKFDHDASCANRLNLDDYQGLVLKFLDIISREGVTNDFTNYSFHYKGVRQKIFVKVLEYGNSRIRLGIRNMSVLGDRR